MDGLRVHYRSEQERVMRESVLAEADRILNHLASMPLAEDACTIPVLRRIMLKTNGWLMLRGHLRDIVAKHLGGGVYRISLAAIDASKGAP